MGIVLHTTCFSASPGNGLALWQLKTLMHTPGPWRLTEDGHVTDAAGNGIVIDGICQPHGYVPPDDVSRANARFIAAAPLMYDALKLFMKFPEARALAEIAAIDAIRKAEGRA